MAQAIRLLDRGSFIMQFPPIPSAQQPERAHRPTAMPGDPAASIERTSQIQRPNSRNSEPDSSPWSSRSRAPNRNRPSDLFQFADDSPTSMLDYPAQPRDIEPSQLDLQG